MRSAYFRGTVVLLVGFAVAAPLWAQSANPLRAPAAGAIPPPPNPQVAGADVIPAEDGRVTTRQNVFTIPFFVNRPEGSDQQPVEVQLYVSADTGEHWTLYQRQLPTAGKFHFRAGKDGEYWFLVRTLDSQGRLSPAGRPQPELRVTVDTEAPRLDLAAAIVAPGEVRTAWDAQDTNLAAESFQLVYSEDAGATWKPVPNAESAGVRPGPRLAGELTWRPGPSASQIQVRAEVRDRAGNWTVINRQVAPGGGADPAVSPADPAGDEAKRGPSAPAALSRSPAALPIPWVGQRVGSTPRPGDDAAVGPGPPAGAPAQGSGPGLLEITQLVPRGESPATAAGGVQPPVQRPAAPSAASPYTPVQGPVRPPVSHPATEPGRLPPGELPRPSRSRRFQLDYEIDPPGPAGASKVELWITRDGGQAWSVYGEDVDRKSPFLVEVDGDGAFGFRMVVYDARGFSGRPPRPGDPADVWVLVDTDPPEVRLTSARYGQGERLGYLDITWEAVDRQLGERPVTLQFAAGTAGPWTTIASGIANTGRYEWRVDARLPTELYLRLEVRDDAGNVAADQLAQPISTDGLAPKARIRSVEPAEAAGADR